MPPYLYCSAWNGPKAPALSAGSLPSISFQFPHSPLPPRGQVVTVQGAQTSLMELLRHAWRWWQHSPSRLILKTQPGWHRHWPEGMLAVTLAQAYWRVSGRMDAFRAHNPVTPHTPDFGKGNLLTHREFPTFSDTYKHSGHPGGMVPQCWQPASSTKERLYWQCRELHAAELCGVRGLCSGF